MRAAILIMSMRDITSIQRGWRSLVALLFVSVGCAAAANSPRIYWPVTTDISKRPQLVMDLPGYLQPVTDPSLGNMLMRISDPSVFGGYRTSNTGLKMIKHHYAKDSVWNADESLIFLENAKYDGALLDGRTYKFLRYLPRSGFNMEKVWSNIDPNIMYGVRSGSAALGTLNVRTGARTIIANFPQYSWLSLGSFEGNISDDDGLVCLMGQRGTDLDIISYNIAKKAISGKITLANAYQDKQIDFCTATPSGKYIAVGFSKGTVFGYQDDSLVIFDAKMNYARQIAGKTHVDFTYDMSGDEVVVGNTSSTGDIWHQFIHSTSLSDGKTTVQLPPGTVNNPTHTSCRATRRPGWCYFSEYANTDASHPVSYYNEYFNYNEVFAVKLDGSGTIERIAKAHHVTDPSFDSDTNDAYNRSAMAVPSRHGDRVIFASDWGDTSPSAFVHTFVSWWPVSTSKPTANSASPAISPQALVPAPRQ
jgi:hypothetical protein